MSKVKFNIEVEMEEVWIDDFCSMLKEMQSCGEIGHSSIIGFYSDGDGSFRPEFKIGINYNLKEGRRDREKLQRMEMEVFYDLE